MGYLQPWRPLCVCVCLCVWACVLVHMGRMGSKGVGKGLPFQPASLKHASDDQQSQTRLPMCTPGRDSETAERQAVV